MRGVEVRRRRWKLVRAIPFAVPLLSLTLRREGRCLFRQPVESAPVRIGIDIGGTKIEAIALDDSGAELMRHRVPTPGSDYPAVLDAVHDLVVSFERDLGARASVGVGHPGTISPATGYIKNSNSQALLGKRLDRDLATALDRPVRLANRCRNYLGRAKLVWI